MKHLIDLKAKIHSINIVADLAADMAAQHLMNKDYELMDYELSREKALRNDVKKIEMELEYLFGRQLGFVSPVLTLILSINLISFGIIVAVIGV